MAVFSNVSMATAFVNVVKIDGNSGKGNKSNNLNLIYPYFNHPYFILHRLVPHVDLDFLEELMTMKSYYWPSSEKFKTLIEANDYDMICNYY